MRRSAFVAVIHNTEASLDFSKHLHNGDPSTGYVKPLLETDERPGDYAGARWRQHGTEFHATVGGNPVTQARAM